MQSFVVPGGSTSVELSFLLFIGNRAAAFVTPNSLDFNVSPNQQARVDILTAAGTAFDLTPADIAASVYQTHVGDALVSSYSLHSSIVSGLTAGATYQLRFAEVDNQGNFQMGVDSVSINAIPEPASFGLTGITGIALVVFYRRARVRPRYAR
jgi:hypothetical protein